MTNQPDHATIYRNVFLFMVTLAAIAFFVPLPGDLSIPLRGALVIFSVYFGFKWIYRPRRARHEAPDILADHVRSYFERDGLCFAPRLSVTDELCWFEILLQNRYDRPCRGTIFFIPMEGIREHVPHDVEPVVADVECDGGEAGIVSFPYPIAAHWQGKVMVYDVMAQVDYPQGYGRLVRTSEGASVNEPSSDLAEILTTAGAFVLGTVRIARSASCELQLPQGVRTRAPADVTTRSRTLWEYAPPTGGFPIS